MASGRRFIPGDVRFAGRSWEDVAPQLEFLLGKLFAAEANGIPPGFNNLEPTTIVADAVGSPGNLNSGWAAADHEHPVDTDAVLERAYAFAFLGY